MRTNIPNTSIDFLVDNSRAKYYLCRIRFCDLLLKTYGGFFAKYMRHNYACDHADLILNFLEKCERSYAIRVHELEKLKEEIEKERIIIEPVIQK